MDIVTTSLDALLHRATNSENQNVDTAAVEAFCVLMSKEKDGTQIGTKLLATRMHSRNVNETMGILTILETCMKRCNHTFHSEIAKFRFLNEMIKLVSPKYLGMQTPMSVKQKVLQLLYIWSVEYPKETKIKEAYDMLKKQGVIRELPLSVRADAIVPPKKVGNSVFNDEEKNRLLQKLLQSKNPDDLQAANRLIKNMVKEDDKRAELKSRRLTTLESANHHVRLLNEMLDSYTPGISSVAELELMKELHNSCERLRPNIYKLAEETQQNEELLNEILQASDDLGSIFQKYKNTFDNPVCGNIQHLSLLDFASSEVQVQATPEQKTTPILSNDCKTDMDLLCDVFSSNVVPAAVLKPISSKNDCDSAGNEIEEPIEKSNKFKALDDLDALGEHLMKENLVSQRMGPQFNKISEKIPMNLLVKQSSLDIKSAENDDTNKLALGEVLNLDLNYLMDKKNQNDESKNEDSNGDDVLVDISSGRLDHADLVNINNVIVSPKNTDMLTHKPELKLNDIFIKLEEIKPSSTTPLVVLQEKNGITVTFHFGKNKPRQDVNIIVITTISKNELPLSNFLFQAVVPKNCKLKLQPPSNTELPTYNPFLPPSAITQIMLIANPQETNISLKFIISYVMDDETVTEMGEVDSLPVIPS